MSIKYINSVGNVFELGTNSIKKLSYTSEQVSTGIDLLDNCEISISDALNTINILSSLGSGVISFVAGSAVIFSFPSGVGWVGNAPSFKVGYFYNIVYYNGGFYADQGRLIS